MTYAQARKVYALVRKRCCNYDEGNCLLLDDGYDCGKQGDLLDYVLCEHQRMSETEAVRHIQRVLGLPITELDAVNANDLMEDKGGLVITNVNHMVMEIFKITGFSEYLKIQ